MPRAALSEIEIDQFRESICEVAQRLFAEHGYAGVTMRALASELGCSPMTPYRYFANKDEIFDAVRSFAFERFADAQAIAFDEQVDSAERLAALARAYVRFALDEPHAYRIMFELDPPNSASALIPASAEHRAWSIMRGVVEDAVAAGSHDEDPDTLAHLFWSGVHGLVALHLAGKLVLGKRLEDLIEPFIERTIGSLQTGATAG